ncbi:hypothetical protein CEXT_528571 [Caerostris extrusa]|uniref:Uncharacterized protein n=1 Tax=Caerostris extrusa TaxID=172846 RepID=A0AAV4V866_CAEEX|nr:hypothetical protein CEXT_528571 [Caerostris extrusa]
MDIVRGQILPTFALPFIAYHHGILRSGSWGSHMYGRYPYSFNHKAFRHLDMYGHSKAPNPANICITLHSISSWNSKVRIMGIAYVWAVSILFLIIKPFGTWTCMDIVRRQILPTFALPFIAYHHGILRSGSWGSHMYGRYPYSF